MNPKFNVRLLTGLLAMAVFIVGYFVFRSRQSQEAVAAAANALRDLSLSEDIIVHIQYSELNTQESRMISGKRPDPFPKESAVAELESRLIKDIGKQLREGDVKFNPSLPLPSENWVSPTPEQLSASDRAGTLSLVANIYFVRGIYIGEVQANLKQKVFLPSNSSQGITVTTWDNGSSMLSKFSAASQEEIPTKLQAKVCDDVDSLISAYRSANNMPPIVKTDANGKPIYPRYEFLPLRTSSPTGGSIY